MKNMSFFMTTQQIKNCSKTVTRRVGWWNLKAGERLCAVLKSQGLRKGEKITRLAVIEIVSVCKERLFEMPISDLEAEGFPALESTDAFISMFCKINKCEPSAFVNRIEFRYLWPYAGEN
jgi:hypothetical protein